MWWPAGSMVPNSRKREEVGTVGALWDIVQKHMDEQPYGASLRGVARKLDLSPTALSNWRDPKALPQPAHLRALADLTGTAYSRVLDAALEDAGYLERPRDPQDAPPSSRAAVSGAQVEGVRMRARTPSGPLPGSPSQEPTRSPGRRARR